jgi:HSP20 family protein
MSNLTRNAPISPLDDFFRGFFVRPVEFGGNNAELPSVRIDVKTQDNGYLVHAELPGVNKEDIHVDIDGSVVSISAERKQEKEVKEGERILRTERYFGKVARSFDLGTEIDEAAASAKYTDGVLELTLPKKISSANKRLQIQ